MIPVFAPAFQPSKCAPKPPRHGSAGRRSRDRCRCGEDGGRARAAASSRGSPNLVNDAAAVAPSFPCNKHTCRVRAHVSLPRPRHEQPRRQLVLGAPGGPRRAFVRARHRAVRERHRSFLRRGAVLGVERGSGAGVFLQAAAHRLDHRRGDDGVRCRRSVRASALAALAHGNGAHRVLARPAPL